MYEHLVQSATQLSILLANPVKSDSIYKNIVQIMGYCALSTQKICCQEGEVTKLLVEEGTRKFWIGGTCLDWGGRDVPLDGSGPPIHNTLILDSPGQIH